MTIFERLESQVQSYARSFPAVFETASGAWLIDGEGQRYLDFLSGAGSLNYGHNHPALAGALISYIKRGGVTHSLDMHTGAKAAFLEALEHLILMPRDLHYRIQFPGPTGANAVEAAFKLARRVTGRRNIVAFTNGFHGVTVGALSATGNAHHRGAAGVDLNGVVRMPYEGYLGENVDSISYLERSLSDPSSGVHDVAAVIVECVQGEGGLRSASRAWLQGLARVCSTFGVLLIVDDIQAGCGRTGEFFSFEQAGIVPDLVTLSKSLSGFGLPLSVVLIRPDLDQWKPGEHNGTFRGNNHAFVTAAEALHLFWSSQHLCEDVDRKGGLVEQRFTQLMLDHPMEAVEARGRGMMRGLTLSSGTLAGLVVEEAFHRGLVIETSGSHGEVMKCFAPLTISDTDLSYGLDIVSDALGAAIERWTSEVHAAE